MLVFTGDANIDATAAGTCNTLNPSIAGLYNSTFSNVNASIYIQKYGGMMKAPNTASRTKCRPGMSLRAQAHASGSAKTRDRATTAAPIFKVLNSAVTWRALP